MYISTPGVQILIPGSNPATTVRTCLQAMSGPCFMTNRTCCSYLMQKTCVIWREWGNIIKVGNGEGNPSYYAFRNLKVPPTNPRISRKSPQSMKLCPSFQ
ncbi:hypothetical protein EJ02DRAFT_146273 [Clathrospora elynae]|uniref:Uncharacterized protein n=1 Tax=Clathrospora elynae TaxID=706981 RepID=A0A6A5SRP8_9PLEO|nr:hypothetical protein EJ02DRAFT_146273 [Clathrospora elynae]